MTTDITPPELQWWEKIADQNKAASALPAAAAPFNTAAHPSSNRLRHNGDSHRGWRGGRLATG